MDNIRRVAHDTVDRILQKGLAQGHGLDSWKTEPVTMHLQKAARHALTAEMLVAHPEYNKDKETALEHAQNSLCRIAMCVAILQESLGQDG